MSMLSFRGIVFAPCQVSLQAAAAGTLPCLALVAGILLGMSSAASTRPGTCVSVLDSLHLPAWPFVLVVRACGYSAYGSVLYLPRRRSLRLLLFCTCPTLCTGAVWPMPSLAQFWCYDV